MAEQEAAAAAAAAEQPPYPSWEAAVNGAQTHSRTAHGSPMLALAFYRIRWLLFGAITSPRLSVLDDPADPASASQPFATASGPRDGDGDRDRGITLHPIAHESLMDPPISAVTVEVDDLTERDWDQDEPPTLLVLPAAGHAYITIGQYVTAVHAWLTSMKDDIFDVKQQNYGELPVRGLIWVSIPRPSTVMLWEEEGQGVQKGSLSLSHARAYIEARDAYAARAALAAGDAESR